MYSDVKCNFLIVAYRGYSSSTGLPSEEGIKIDALAIMDFTFTRGDIIDLDNVYVFGRSLGGAVSVWALSTGDYNVKGRVII